ncbi:hypothetical protein CWI39_1501p0020 [Hamiltosporidium magnivora]|uniref:Uncharacterized protein n=1 Tax=Hamiltosporidium magnivora TaxID=148818 RepID=A0A4Q9L2G2_9MICR|nr:hypothetical protein CWI39_1501p0020 [Hamiltosporidium magnivora]
MERKKLSSEDIENMKTILNPYPVVLENFLDNIENSTDLKEKLEEIEELSSIMVAIDVCGNPDVMNKFERIMKMMEQKELYGAICRLFADCCQNFDVVQAKLVKIKIFEKIKYNWSLNDSTYLLFSLCMNNPAITKLFFSKYYRPDLFDPGNDRIGRLIEYYGSLEATTNALN